MYNHLLVRGKAPDGQWFEGYYLYKPNDTCMGPSNEKHMILAYYFYDWSLSDLIATQVDPNTVDQFTGFVDSDNIKIFENDIVEFHFSSGFTRRYLIWWNKEGNQRTAVNLDELRFNGQDYYNARHQMYTYSDFCLLMQDPWGHISSIKVIGNLHDNPELIKSEG